MAKKKKEVCPYCGKSFAYLSRHKCRIKERVEGNVEDKTQVERRIERKEETKKQIKRKLKKDERNVLNIINRQKDLYFSELLKLSNKNQTELDNILDILVLQSRISINRELYDSSWTKRISSIEDYSEEIDVKDLKISKKKKDFIWDMFSRQPCFICPFQGKCNDTNLDILNPHHCPWLTDWITVSIKGDVYNTNFDEDIFLK